MALQIRRGTSASRTSITPDVGELIYTTDTKLVYVGDGTTAGGTVISGGGGGLANVVEDLSPQLGGNLDINNFEIVSTGNQNIILNPAGTGQVEIVGDIDMSAPLSSINAAGTLNINAVGLITIGSSSRLIDADIYIVRNSYDADPSAGLSFVQHHDTPDAVNVNFYRSRGVATATTAVQNNDDIIDINFNAKTTSTAISGAATLSVVVDGNPTTTNVPAKFVFATNNGTVRSTRVEISATGVLKTNQLGALTGTTITVPTNNNITVGDIRLNQNGLSTVNTNASLTLSANGTGAVNVESLSIIGNTVDTTDSSNISFLVNTTFTNDVTVNNDLRVTNKVYAESFISTSVGTPSIQSATNIELRATTGVVISGSPLRLASMSSSQRDALVAQNGDLIYNTTTNKFQGYENGAWANLI